MRRIEGKRVGRANDVIKEYYKLREKRILPTRIRYWRERGLLKGCIVGRTKGNQFLYDVDRTIRRLDTIFVYKDAYRLKLGEIYKIIIGRLKDEDYYTAQRGEV